MTLILIKPLNIHTENKGIEEHVKWHIGMHLATPRLGNFTGKTAQFSLKKKFLGKREKGNTYIIKGIKDYVNQSQ